jgi:hypothetical protein
MVFFVMIDDITTSDDVITRDVVITNMRIAGHIFMKFVMDVMPLEASPNLCILISFSW